MTRRVDEVADEPAGPGLTSRRTVASGFGVLAVLGLARPAFPQGARPALAPAGMQPAAAGARIFLTDAEAAFIEAAVARLIPAEGDGPGAVEAGVPNFIDKQLGGAWGGGERLFTGGPFNPAAPPQYGYQLPYVPAEMFRRGMAAISRMEKGAAFASLSTDEQDSFISEQLEGGKAGDLDGVPATVFFDQLLQITIQGYFSDPAYGGNKDMVAWKAIGFPGAYDAYRDMVGQHGKRFDMGPFSMTDHDTMPEHDQHSMEAQK